MSPAEQPSRFSQAQILIAALFAVVFSGSLPDDVRLGQPDSKPVPPPHTASPPDESDGGAFARAALYRGCYAKVAKRLGVSLSIVCRVAKGKATSKRIAAEIAKEELRIESLVRQQRRRAA